MDNETIFYICGIALAVSAVLASFAGLKVKGFPGRVMPLIVLWFVALILATTTFAVRNGQEEEQARAAETEQAGEEIEKGETSGPFENEGGALGGESEEGEREAEEEAEGPTQEEPVGPAEGEQSESSDDKGGEEKGGGSGASASTTLDLAADPTQLAFDKTQLSAKAGEVKIDFDNPSAIPHNVVIEEDGKELAGFEPIAESNESLEAELKPGTYTFYCSVPGHREAGMEGQLTVK
jgi:plastocyanin